jgi:hypothetical protein
MTATDRPNLNKDRNLSGQVRRKPVRDALVAILARSADDQLTDKPKTIAQELALTLIIEARAGDRKSREEVIDRTDGKAAQAIEHSGVIARSAEELLQELDNPETDDTNREDDTPPAA